MDGYEDNLISFYRHCRLHVTLEVQYNLGSSESNTGFLLQYTKYNTSLTPIMETYTAYNEYK